MNPITLLKDLSLLKDNKTVLDVGTKDGFIATQFAELGMDVEAIDINPLPVSNDQINFKKISVSDFLTENEKRYDIVICRHVLHHLPNPTETIKRLNGFADIFFFTCFGEKDDWASKVSTLTHEEVLAIFPKKTVRHHSEAFQYGKTYAGDTKFWHINTFVIDNR